MECIFCQIAKKQAPAEFFYEDERVFAIKPLESAMPVHILIIPKKHIPCIDCLEPEDKPLLAEMFFVAKKLAKEKGVSSLDGEDKGYKLVFNVGKGADQTVNHLHLHLLAK
jgi:histidine triad (HIT) family protein